jgi:hypothetical protein
MKAARLGIPFWKQRSDICDTNRLRDHRQAQHSTDQTEERLKGMLQAKRSPCFGWSIVAVKRKIPRASVLR